MNVQSNNNNNNDNIIGQGVCASEGSAGMEDRLHYATQKLRASLFLNHTSVLYTITKLMKD